MKALLLNPLLSRLGLTLIHALWELLALGLLAWTGLAFLRRQSSSTRYAFAYASLLAMLAAPLITFMALQPASPSLVTYAEGITLQAEPSMEGSGLLARGRTFLPWLAIFWSLGAAAMALRLGGGIWWLDRAYLSQARPASGPWQARLDRVAHRMGLRRPVRLLESRRTDSPLVIGWLRPVVLVPASALLSLSPEALEAIMAHELAHIRRQDYLANLLQGLAEALLFFHPAAWWLSHQIRELREHCCDDAASALCGDPLILAQGLSALERLRRSLHTDPEPALGAAKGKLMPRITRLFQPQDVQAPSLRGLAALLIGISLVGVTALAAQKPTRPTKPATPKAQPKADAEGEIDLDSSKVKVTHQPKPPAYPEEAKAQKIQGVVIAALTIDEKGVPVSAKALEGPEALQAIAIDWAKEWRFKPVMLNGKPVKARFKLTMVFKLK